MRYLGLITARGGSKGVPHKNIMIINGKPLIQYTIETALMAKSKGLLDSVVVSTDDPEIAEISKDLGAEAPFLRPDYLAADGAKSIDVLIHAVEFFKSQGVDYDAVVLLQPTTPLRQCDDIENCIELFEKESAISLFTASKEESFNFYVSYYKDGNRGKPLNKDHNKGVRRQDVEPIYIRNGAVYITRTDYLLNEHYILDDHPLMVVMPPERSVNIDSWQDVYELKWRLSLEEN